MNMEKETVKDRELFQSSSKTRSTLLKGPVIIYHLGGGGGREVGGFWGGSLKILEGFRGGTTQICLNNVSLKAYNINVPILLGDDGICNLNLFY